MNGQIPKWLTKTPKTFGTYSSAKVEIILEQRQVAFLSPMEICENLNFLGWTVEKFKFSQILLGDKNATSLCFKNISIMILTYLF